MKDLVFLREHITGLVIPEEDIAGLVAELLEERILKPPAPPNKKKLYWDSIERKVVTDDHWSLWKGRFR